MALNDYPDENPRWPFSINDWQAFLMPKRAWNDLLGEQMAEYYSNNDLFDDLHMKCWSSIPNNSACSEIPHRTNR